LVDMNVLKYMIIMKVTITSLLLFAVALTIFTYGSEVVGLEFKGDEGFYYQASKQMLDTGDWVTPYYFDRSRFEKPPLYYWITAAFFKLLGEEWKTARLPAALSMALALILMYLLGIKFYDKKRAFIASLIFISTIATFRYSRLALPESLFLLLLTASLYSMLKEKYILAYIATGLLFLIKGPVGFILPVFIMAIYHYGRGERGFFRRTEFAKGLAITLLIGLPWFLLMANTHGKAYIDHIFFRETVERIGNFKFALFYFVPVIFIFYLPWSLILIPAIKKCARSISDFSARRDGAIFTFAWFFGVIVFFTFLGEKHRHYMLYLAVPAALILGDYFGAVFADKKRAAIPLFAILFLSLFSFEYIKLEAAREIGGIGALFRDKDYGIAASDTVATGSHTMVPQELEVAANHPVEVFAYKWPSKEETAAVSKKRLNKVLFRKGRDAYLLIKADDFSRFIAPDIKNGLTILAKGYMYSKGRGLHEALEAAANPGREAFLDLFRDKIYFVTNKKGIAYE